MLSQFRNRFKTAVTTAQVTVGINNQRISASTVRRRLRECDIRSHNAIRGNVLTPIRRQNRYDWCNGHSVSGKALFSQMSHVSVSI